MDNSTSHNTQDSPRNKRFSFPYKVNSGQYLWIVGIFALIGVAGGFAYYTFIGCRTGGCAITSNPYMSMLWGGAMGYLLPDFFFKKQKPEPEQEG